MSRTETFNYGDSTIEVTRRDLKKLQRRMNNVSSATEKQGIFAQFLKEHGYEPSESSVGDTFTHTSDSSDEERFESMVEPLPYEETTEAAREEVVNEQGAEEVVAEPPEGEDTEPAAPTFKEEDGAVRVTSSATSRGNCTLEPDEDGYVKLPEVYQEKYTAAGENEDAQRKVILAFLNDEEYFPKQTVTETSNVYGTRTSARDEGGLKFHTELGDIQLIDGDGKPIEKNAEKRYVEVREAYDAQMKERLDQIGKEKEAEINERKDLTAEQKKDLIELEVEKAKRRAIAEESVDSYYGPELKEVELGINDKRTMTPTEAKSAYYQLVMTQDEKNKVAEEAGKITKQMSEVLNKPEGQLTDEDKALLAKWKEDFNKKFPSDNQFGEGKDLSHIGQGTKKEKEAVLTNMNALAQMEAIETVMETGDGNLDPDQVRRLARAQVVETITHENAISKLCDQAAGATDEEKTKIERQIEKLSKDAEGRIETLNNCLVATSAKAQVDFETYKQNYKNTVVHWDEAGAKADEKTNPDMNNTTLNKAARNLIQTNEEFRNDTCDKVAAGKGDFEVDGQWYKFNSAKYKDVMLGLSNPDRSDYGANEQEADYYASVSEFSAFANKYLAHKASGAATLKERKYAQEMFEAAGLQTSTDPTRRKRYADIGKAAGYGALGGLVSGLVGESLGMLQNQKYAGTAVGVAKDVITGWTQVKGYNKDVEVTSNNVTHTIRQEYNSATGQWITTSDQITTQPVTSVQNVEIDYYKPTIEDQEIPAEYSGKQGRDFSWGNLGLQVVTGAALGAGIKGLTNLFKKKKISDYVNTDNRTMTTRSNTGYQQKTTTVVEPEKSPVKAETTRTVEETVEVPIAKHPYTMRATRVGNQNEGDTLAEVIRAKYNLTSSADIKKVLDYVIKENGLGNVSRNSIKKFDLPDVIPDSVLGREIHYVDNDPKMSLFDLAGGKGSPNNGSINGTTSSTSTTTVHGIDHWDKNANKE